MLKQPKDLLNKILNEEMISIDNIRYEWFKGEKKMKKQLIITLVAVLLIVLGFSGCFEEDNDKKEDENPSIGYTLIGSWETYPYYYENGVRIDDAPSTAIIYENGTMASISVVDGSTIWSPYSMVNEQFCLGEEPDVYCYDIEFFDNGNRVILSTYYEDPETGLMNQIFIELIRTL